MAGVVFCAGRPALRALVAFLLSVATLLAFGFAPGAQGAIAEGCNNAPCGPNATCTELTTNSTPPHHTCHCLPGFHNSTAGCEPIDYCAEPCIAHQLLQRFDSVANTTSGWLRDGLPYSTVTTCGDSDLLGGYGEASAGTVLSRTFSALPAHASLSLKLTVLAMDLWEGEGLVLLVDGVQVAAQAGINTNALASGADRCGLPGQDPGMYELSAHTPHSAASLTVRLEVTPNQGLGNESWGLVGFQLELRRAEPCHTCSPHATCSSATSGPSCTCNPGFVGNGSSCEGAAVCFRRCNDNPCDASGACRCEEPFYHNGTSCAPGACLREVDVAFGPTSPPSRWTIYGTYTPVVQVISCPERDLLGPFTPGFTLKHFHNHQEVYARLQVSITFAVTGAWHGEQLSLYENGKHLATSDPIHVLPNVTEPCGQSINGSTLLNLKTPVNEDKSNVIYLRVHMSSVGSIDHGNTWAIASVRYLADGDASVCGANEQCQGTEALTCTCASGMGGDPCADVDECAAPACPAPAVVETFSADQPATGWPISTVTTDCTHLPPFLGGVGVLSNQTMSKLFTGISAHSSVSVELQLVMLDAWAATLGSPDLIRVYVDGTLSGQTPTPISALSGRHLCGELRTKDHGLVTVKLSETLHSGPTLELSLAPRLAAPGAFWGIARVTVTLDSSASAGCNECSKPHMACSNTWGGSSCNCARGYHLLGGECVDFNECEQNTGHWSSFSEGEETGWVDATHGHRPVKATTCNGTPMIRASGPLKKFARLERTFDAVPGHYGVNVWVTVYLVGAWNLGEEIFVSVSGVRRTLTTFPAPSGPGCDGPQQDVGEVTLFASNYYHQKSTLEVAVFAENVPQGSNVSFGVIDVISDLRTPQCKPGETCANVPGSFECTCGANSIYTLDGGACVDAVCPAFNGSEHSGFNLTGCAEGHAGDSPDCTVQCATGYGSLGLWTCARGGDWVPAYPLCADYDPVLNVTAGAPYTGPSIRLSVDPASTSSLTASVVATNLDARDTLTVSNDPADFGSITAMFSPTVDRTGRPPIRVQLNLSYTDEHSVAHAVGLPEFELELSAPLASSGSTQFAFGGQGYIGQKPEIVGGKPPYSFGLGAGTLPAGLKVNGEGTIIGTPAEVGDFSGIVVQVHDSNGASISLEPVNFQIIPALEVRTATPGLLPTAVAGVEYFQEFNFTAAGGSGEVTFATTGSVPAVLDVDPQTGALTGFPLPGSARPEPYLFEIVASDDSGIVVPALVVSLVVEARPDCDDPGNGPNGQGCGTGLCLDLVAFDGAFSCECNATGLGGDNCHLVDTGEVTVAGGSSRLSPTILGTIGALAALLLIVLVVVVLVRRAQVRARNQPFDFQTELERMREEGLIVLFGGKREAGVPREIRRDTIQLLDKLGAGQFGDVFKGTVDESAATGIPAYLVAVKTLKGDPSSWEMTELMREATLMAQFRHPNVVNIVGVCTKGGPYYLVAQFCEHGSLVDYLKAQPLPLEEATMMKMAHEIATGMGYLAGAGLVHRDLAARNVLLDSHLVCKVADFGMSRDVATTDKDYYRAGKGGMMPVRWTAPEALEEQMFSQQSDVWAWGITVYEILTGGALPYGGWNNQKVWVNVKGGFRLSCPKGVTPRLFHEIVVPCWCEDPGLRPTFNKLCRQLEGHLEGTQQMKNHYLTGSKIRGGGVVDTSPGGGAPQLTIDLPAGNKGEGASGGSTTLKKKRSGRHPARTPTKAPAADYPGDKRKGTRDRTKDRSSSLPREAPQSQAAPSSDTAVVSAGGFIYAPVDLPAAARPVPPAPKPRSIPDYGESPVGFRYASIDLAEAAPGDGDDTGIADVGGSVGAQALANSVPEPPLLLGSAVGGAGEEGASAGKEAVEWTDEDAYLLLVPSGARFPGGPTLI